MPIIICGHSKTGQTQCLGKPVVTFLFPYPEIMNHYLKQISLDKAIAGLTTLTAAVVLGEAYTRTNLHDAQTAKECRYPPLSRIITGDHVRELEQNDIVVIQNVLTPSELHNARLCAQKLTESNNLNVNNHENEIDVRQDQICLVREGDHKDHCDDMIHCIKLLRGIPYMLNRFHYSLISPSSSLSSSSSFFVVPRQCQLARYKPDGSIYVRHLDKCISSVTEMGLVGWLRASDYRYRVVTAILYLNSPQWTNGGKLRCYCSHRNEDDSKQGDDDVLMDVDPIGGTLVLFDSSKIEHEVQSSTKERYALTLWINGVVT